MKYYVGIDLGTTNSVISTFDGENVRVWKSKKDQNDVTPSAIYIDKRGKRYYGKNAYIKYSQDPDRCAVLFKRFMGTSTKINIGDETLTPEECSAEILRELYENLPEEIRETDEVGVVITVPAAFNQMQNAATLEAAKLAGFSHVSLMQEPVAAIMSVMMQSNTNANFLIYDLGGGTLDVAIAESISGKVNLLAHGGMVMCGGRDFDRLLLNNVVNPWIMENYSLPDGWQSKKEYKKITRIASYYIEMAKIELSSDEEATIVGETGVQDLDGEDIYLDITITREQFNELIKPLVDQSIQATRETIEKSGLGPDEFDKIVFIGGPTNYKPLRDMVVNELAIQGSIEVNPMTAVSEGASIYAESIDWESSTNTRKTNKAVIETDKTLGLSFKYISRTNDDKAKILVNLSKEIEGYTLEVTSVDTGWTSGSIKLANKASIVVPLNKKGNNTFTVEVYNDQGKTISVENNKIVIAKTLATVGNILASHSIGIEVQDTTNSKESTLDYIVREGDVLPCKGQRKFRATEAIQAKSAASLNFKLWEGEIEDCADDNRFIGYMKVSGQDFDYGKIMVGAEIICDYTVDESGGVKIEISIPSISEVFNSDRNFYAREEGQMDLDNAADELSKQGKVILEKIKDLGESIETGHEELDSAGELASQAMNVANLDREDIQHLYEKLLSLRKKINGIRRNNLVPIRKAQLESLKEYYHESIVSMDIPKEVHDRYETYFGQAESVISAKHSAFENIINEIKGFNYYVNEKYDPIFVFKWLLWQLEQPEKYRNIDRFYAIKQQALAAIDQGDRNTVCRLIEELLDIKIDVNEEDAALLANIVKG